MSDILDDSMTAAGVGPRKKAWRRNTASTPPEEPEIIDEPIVGPAPRNVGPVVALALLAAASLIILLAVITVTSGAEDVDVAETAGGRSDSAIGSTATGLSEDPVESASTTVANPVAQTPVTVAPPLNPVDIDPSELTLTTFYREIPALGGDFSVAVRLESTADVDAAIADLIFEFDVGGETISPEEVITEHARVPAGGSAVVTIRVDLPPAVGAPTLVVSSVDGELARAILP